MGNLRSRIRRRLEWTLTTDFDPRDPPADAATIVRTAIIILLIIYIWGGLK